MNELITPELSQLPAMPTTEIKIGVDKIGGYIGMLAAVKKATADQKIINEVNDQIRKYSALKLRWQMELGRRTAEIKGSQGARTDFHQPSVEVKTRTEKLKELGIPQQRASENERMASEPEIGEEYIRRIIEQNGTPSTSGALQAIRSIKNSQREYGIEEIVADINQTELQYAEKNEDGTYSIYDRETDDYCTTIGEPSATKKPHVTNNSGDNEWYTPPEYIEAARTVMGSIDLDPASNDYANKTVKALRYFTEQTNGLEQEWFGNIWMNPPYSAGLVKLFANKFADSLFDQAIILVNNATDTEWFKTFVSRASAIVFTTGRIKFRKFDGEKGVPLQGQAFIYCGDNAAKFLKVFGKYGWGAKL